MTTNKRGRPPLTITSPDGTKTTLRELGISRQQKSNWIAMSSIPEDIFEKRLADHASGKRKVTTGALVRLACELGTSNRKAPMRDSSALEDARKALAKLSPREARLLLRELLLRVDCELLLSRDEANEGSNDDAA